MAISLEADPTLAQGYIKVNGTTAATLTASGIVSGGVPAGAILPFARSTAPAGWLAADGTAVSRTNYAALFTAIGTTYGAGDGSTTFALPDLRGIFVRGSGSQTISGITYNKTFAAKEGDAMQGHRHTYGAGYNTYNVAGGGSGIFGNPSTNTTNDPVSDGTNGTPRTANETRPANIALLYCIKF
jgi:microcystin-dependent protein